MNAASAGRMRCPVGCELKLNSSATCSFNVRSWAVCLGQDGSAPTLPCMQILKRFRVDPYLRLPTLRPQWGRGEVRSQIRSYRYGLTFDIEGTWVLCGLSFVDFGCKPYRYSCGISPQIIRAPVVLPRHHPHEALMWTESPFQCLAGLSEQTTNNIVEYVFCVENRICLILPKHPPPLTPGSCRVITFFTPPLPFRSGYRFPQPSCRQGRVVFASPCSRVCFCVPGHVGSSSDGRHRARG